MNVTQAEAGRLGGKDLITIGVYTVIYIVIISVFGALGFIPIFIPLTAVFCPLVGGIPFMLYLTKTKKFGMITIMGTLIGVIMFVMGMGYWIAIVGFISGLIADLVMKAGNYSSAKLSVLACGFFSMWDFGNLMPFFVGREAYLATLEENYGAEYVANLSSYMPMWMMPVLLAATFIFGILGGLLGRAMCKKHFERAGIV
ncbi:MAG: MptD family putative ECF transporter S component [Lachnospiraceae bacterium]|nr:MptD family putative ECF transporter S component [Lachnospiraceae bacterium]